VDVSHCKEVGLDALESQQQGIISDKCLQAYRNSLMALKAGTRDHVSTAIKLRVKNVWSEVQG